VVERGAARFELDATQQRATQGELFVLEPEAVHTGMAAVPEGWAYKVLYIEPEIVHEWDERDSSPRVPPGGWCSATWRSAPHSSARMPRSPPSGPAASRSRRRCWARSRPYALI
jgi:AraC-like ligand binding domain